MQNYRRNSRVSCSIPVLLHVPDSDFSESWGVIFDISEGGVKLETPLLLKRNQNIFLSFLIGKKYHFKNMQSSVLRVLLSGHTYMVGIKFESLKDKNYLVEAIQSLKDFQ